MFICSFQPTVKVKLATFCLKSTLDQVMETLRLGLAEIGTERLKVLDTVGCHGRYVLTVLHRGLGQHHWSGRLGWWFPFLKIGTRIIGVLHYSASLGKSSRGSWNWCFGLFTNPWSSYWSVQLSWHRVSRRSQVHECNRIGNLRIPSLLFADAIHLLASLVNDVWVTLGRFAPEYEAAGMQISTTSSQEVVLCQKLVDCSILMGGEYLVVLFTRNRKMERGQWLQQCRHCIRLLWRRLTRKAKLSIDPSAMLWHSWSWSHDQKKMVTETRRWNKVHSMSGWV